VSGAKSTFSDGSEVTCQMQTLARGIHVLPVEKINFCVTEDAHQ
jgi:hypothetical protein